MRAGPSLLILKTGADVGLPMRMLFSSIHGSNIIAQHGLPLVLQGTFVAMEWHHMSLWVIVTPWRRSGEIRMRQETFCTVRFIDGIVIAHPNVGQ